MLSQQLKSLIANYQKSSQESLLAAFLQLTAEQSQLTTLNEQIDFCLKQSMKSLMTNGQYSSICSLLEVMFDALSNENIKSSAVINLLENVLECVGVADLKVVVKVVRQQIGKFSNLSQLDLNKMLRIINQLLKRVSKEDYQIRGQLHVSLTKIMTVCHDSGFHYRFQPAKTKPILQDTEEISDEQFKKNTDINQQFFQDFWSLQKYFMDVNQLAYDSQTPESEERKPDDEFVSLNLKKIDQIINQTFTYFDRHPPTKKSDFVNFPINFMKLSNLFTLQLSDSYFRKVILLQCLIFCFGLKNSSSKSQIFLKPEQKSIVEGIENKAAKKLAQISSENATINKNFQNFQKDELVWIQDKDNWKQRKKTFFRDPAPQIKYLKQKLINPDAKLELKNTEQPQLHVPINLKEKRQKIAQQVNQKLKRNQENAKKFLKSSTVPQLSKEPVATSFSYYFDQAQSCLQTFDNENGEQTQFQSRAEYNLFEWKGLRSLFRENIGDIFSNKSSQILKDYKMLGILKKKQEELIECPSRKKVKRDEQNEDA